MNCNFVYIDDTLNYYFAAHSISKYGIVSVNVTLAVVQQETIEYILCSLMIHEIS